MDIAHSRPRFRTDLVAAPIDEAGDRFIDVVDPASGKAFRFYEVEFSIACAMDGNRDLTALARWAEAELGLATSPAELSTVVSTLDDLGYLEATPEAAAAAARGAGDFDLGLPGAGAVAEPEAPLPEVDFELGSAGKSLFENDDEERFNAPEITLGESGNETLSDAPSEMPAEVEGEDESPTIEKPALEMLGEPPSAPPEQTVVQPVLRPISRPSVGDDDGPTNLPAPATDFDEELSVDLTDHMRIGTDDVKEAVRQSKVMQAVEVPQEVVSNLAAARSASAVGLDDEEGAATTERAMPPRLEPPPEVPGRGQPPLVAETTELPDEPPSVSRSGTSPPAVGAMDDDGRTGDELSAGRPKSRAGVLLVLLLLVAGGAGAYYYFTVYKPAQEAAEVPVQVADAAPEPAPPEPPPPPPSAQVVSVPKDPIEVAATREGRIAEITAAGTEVAVDEVVVRLDGYQRYDRRIKDHESDIERYRARIAESEAKKTEAEERGSESGVKRAERDIERDQGKITDREARIEAEAEKMAPYLLRAPGAGTVATELEAGTGIEVGQVVFSIELPPVLQATFVIDDGDLPEQDEDVTLAAQDEESKSATCAVVSRSEEEHSITVTCADDSPFAADDIVVLK
ncbi:hypothetical protein [Haliangium sp.]|uniref:hypothetical protein n=1 Tax=Haliangium sp. TaxID=2663208 RepID=UPI003D0FCAC7